MTTIAYKGLEIAVDGQSTVGETIFSAMENKIRNKDNTTFIMSGACEDIELFMRDFRETNPPRRKSAAVSGFIFDHAENILYRGGYDEDGVLHVTPHDVQVAWAYGSGAELALGAMEFGASAEEAVEVAAGRDIYTGGIIRKWVVPHVSKAE